MLSKEKKEKVISTIESHLKLELDPMSLYMIKDKANDVMDKESNPIRIADAVFDYIYDNYGGSHTQSIISKNICNKATLLIMRTDIIKAVS